jgi:hypothetical protein
MCDSKDLLVGFLYDELDADGRRTFELHLAACAECRDEVAGLRTTRTQLARWAPPDPDFAFTIVRRSTAAPAVPRFRLSPAWGLAAAALLVLAAGAAIAQVEVRYGADGLVVRTGWQKGIVTATAPSNSDARVTAADWEALSRRLGDLEAANRRGQPVVEAGQPMSDGDVLRRVRELLVASEARQQRSLVRAIQDLNAQRQVDLVAISQGLTRLQNTSDAEVKQYRDLILRSFRNTAFQPNTSQR